MADEQPFQTTVVKPGEVVVVRALKPMTDMERFKVYSWLKTRFGKNDVVLLPPDLEIKVAEPDEPTL